MATESSGWTDLPKNGSHEYDFYTIYMEGGRKRITYNSSTWKGIYDKEGISTIGTIQNCDLYLDDFCDKMAHCDTGAMGVLAQNIDNIDIIPEQHPDSETIAFITHRINKSRHLPVDEVTKDTPPGNYWM